jgi:phage regulator Rha-like protein
MKTEITKQNIEPRIFTIRGVQVMLDRDLAELFDTETKFVNRAVARNKNRFPLDFVFQLSLIEWESLRFQFGTSNIGSGGRRYLPYVFTEQGVAMLSTALKTEKALSASIQIIRTFVKLRKTLLLSQALTHRVEELELRQSKSEKQIDTILNSLQNKDIPQHGVFFNDQIFDAYVFSCELILKAQKSIILIDNYRKDKQQSLQ